MERQEVKQIHAELNAAIESVLKKYKLTKVGGGVSYSDTEFNYKAKLVKLVTPSSAKSKKIDPSDIRFGFAKPGTILKHNGRDVRILSARRSNYVFEFTDAPGKRYLTKFSAVTM
jgi:hypothetical protein